MNTQQKVIPVVIQKQIDYFCRVFHIWRWVHYVLGMLAVTCSILVANYPTDGDHWVPISMSTLALIAAIFTGLLTFMGAESKSKNYFRAWRLLESATATYLLGAEDEKFLAEQHVNAEAIISSPDG